MLSFLHTWFPTEFTKRVSVVHTCCIIYIYFIFEHTETQIEDDPCAPEVVEAWAAESEHPWERIRERIKRDVDFVWASFDHRNRPLTDFNHKMRILILLENRLGIPVPSYALREMKSKEGSLTF